MEDDGGKQMRMNVRGIEESIGMRRKIRGRRDTQREDEGKEEEKGKGKMSVGVDSSGQTYVCVAVSQLACAQ